MPTKNEAWSNRQAAIKKILATDLIKNQIELQKRLQACGFNVTQSSVSRDLQELRAIKVDGHYALEESLRNNGVGTVSLSDELGEVAASINEYRTAGPYLLVINTPPGRASVVGLAIDRADWPEIIGTVAGDDTLFIATAGRRAQEKVNARLAALRKRIYHV